MIGESREMVKSCGGLERVSDSMMTIKRQFETRHVIILSQSVTLGNGREVLRTYRTLFKESKKKKKGKVRRRNPKRKYYYYLDMQQGLNLYVQFT